MGVRLYLPPFDHNGGYNIQRKGEQHDDYSRSGGEANGEVEIDQGQGYLQKDLFISIPIATGRQPTV